jgi:hypothetical protein
MERLLHQDQVENMLSKRSVETNHLPRVYLVVHASGVPESMQPIRLPL